MTVILYIGALRNAYGFLNRPFDAEDAMARRKTVLRKTPHDGRIWLELAQLVAPGANQPQLDLDRIAAAEPCYINAMVYSNDAYDTVKSALAARVWALLDPANILKARDISTLPAMQRAKLDSVVHCPTLARVRHPDQHLRQHRRSKRPLRRYPRRSPRDHETVDTGCSTRVMQGRNLDEPFGLHLPAGHDHLLSLFILAQIPAPRPASRAANRR